MSDALIQQSIARLVPIGSRVLDLGCGDGALLALLQNERGCSGYGVELADGNLRACVERGVNAWHCLACHACCARLGHSIGAIH